MFAQTFGNVEAVGGLQIQKKKHHTKTAPLRPLLDLVFAHIMNRNKYGILYFFNHNAHRVIRRNIKN